AALNMAIEDISALPEKNRILLKMAIQRIQDIANNLLRNTQGNDLNGLETTYIYPSLDEILSEKRLEFKTLSHIEIHGDFVTNQALFSRVNVTLLKQIISNLINNSVEAITNSKGRITLSLEFELNSAIIKIEDNGKGIPQEVLLQLGREGLSFGKDSHKTSGFGIGVKHAIDTIKSWEGDINFSSKEGIGTSVTIKLPLIDPP